MHTPHLPGDRFFARIRALDLECPNCGSVVIISTNTKRLSRTKRANRALQPDRRNAAQVRELIWDDLLQRFSCHTCKRSYALGIVAWPVRMGGKLRPPQDTIPTPRQAQAIRNQAGGFYLRTRKGADDPRNVVVTQECICAPDTRTSHPSCPVHGPDGNQPTGPHLPATPPKQELGTAGHRPRPHASDYDEEP